MVLVGQGDQDLGDHVAVRAEGDLLVGHAAHQGQGRPGRHPSASDSSSSTLTWKASASGAPCRRSDGRAREDPSEGEYPSRVSTRLRACLEPRVERRPGPIGTLRITARPGVGMTDQKHGHRASLPGPWDRSWSSRGSPGRARVTYRWPDGSGGTTPWPSNGSAPQPARRPVARPAERSWRRGWPAAARPSALGPLRRGIREVGLALITAGVIVLLFVGYQLWGTGIAEAHSQAALKRGFNADRDRHPGEAAGGNPTRRPPAVGTTGGASRSPPTGAVDHLVIPKIHLDVFVVEGVAEDDLRQGPGHYPQTVFPGQDGNAAIAGHRTTYGAPFFSLNELSRRRRDLRDRHDRPDVHLQGVRPPAVVSPNDVAVLDPTPFAELTLTTCNPRYSATSRLIIVARLTGRRRCRRTRRCRCRKPVRRGHAVGEPPPVVAADNLGRGNRGAWPPALAFGALVVLLWIGVRILVNRTRRWARAGVLVAAIAVCLVPLWFCVREHRPPACPTTSEPVASLRRRPSIRSAAGAPP